MIHLRYLTMGRLGCPADKRGLDDLQLTEVAPRYDLVKGILSLCATRVGSGA